VIFHYQKKRDNNMPLPFDFSNTIIESGDAKVVTDLLFEAHYILKIF
jgi:hypothetical protein